jgi:hypothetical protein
MINDQDFAGSCDADKLRAAVGDGCLAYIATNRLPRSTSTGMGACVGARFLTPLHPSPGTDRRNMGLDEAIRALEVASTIAEAVPVLGIPVKAALEAASKIVDFAKVRRPMGGVGHAVLMTYL